MHVRVSYHTRSCFYRVRTTMTYSYTRAMSHTYTCIPDTCSHTYICACTHIRLGAWGTLTACKTRERRHTYSPNATHLHTHNTCSYTHTRTDTHNQIHSCQMVARRILTASITRGLLGATTPLCRPNTQHPCCKTQNVCVRVCEYMKPDKY